MKKNFSRKFFFTLLGMGASFATMAQTVTVEAEKFDDDEADYKYSAPISEQGQGGGGSNLGYFDEEGESIVYHMKAPKAGFYQVSIKYIAQIDAAVKITMDNGTECSLKLKGNYSGGENWWQPSLSNYWETDGSESPALYLEEGDHSFTLLKVTSGSTNIDKLEFALTDITDNEVTKIKTNPSKLVLTPYEQTYITLIGYNAAGQKISMPITWPSKVENGLYTAGSEEGTDELSIKMGNYTEKISVKVQKPKKRREFVVSKHGDLNTNKGYVGDGSGNKVSLAGVSYFWSCSSSLWWCKENVKFLVDKYNVQVLRLPVSIAPCGSNGQSSCDKSNLGAMGGAGLWNMNNYVAAPMGTKRQVDEVVKACIENDIYVIIDFHEHKAQDWTSKANEFFTYFAKKWGEYPNVMYEIFNEPVDDNGTVVNYAKQVIPTIRAIDPDNVIIVGSTQFSRDPDGVTGAGQGQTNIAYTWHGYAQYNHQTDWNNKPGWNNDIPVVVTEWGCDAGGSDGGMHNIFKEHGVINCFWSMSNKGGEDERWSILKTTCYKAYDWSDSDMNGNGKNQLSAVSSWVNYKATPMEEENEEFTVSISKGGKIFLPENEVSVSCTAAGGTGNYTYQWQQVTGDAATITSPTSAKTTITGLKAGSNIFTVTISDGEETETLSVSFQVYKEGYVDPGLIDDVADNDLTSRIGGIWVDFDDASDRGTSKATVSAEKGYISVDAKMGGTNGNVPPYCGVDLYLDKTSTVESPVAYDITNCSKITYKFKGSEHYFRAAMSKNSINDGNYHCALIEGSNDWKEVSIDVSSLAQENWGRQVTYDPKDVIKFSWMAKGGDNSTKKLEIDDVTCVGMEFEENIDRSGLQNSEAINGTYLFPNPSEDGECVLFVLNRCKVSVTDIAGKVVKEFVAIPNFANQFSIKEKGVYFVNADGEVLKLIVK
ncbi:MAG: cellulase family glycosylhydrolase [Paludibacteraceae bacterium]|nr:cellulase family glycosylhydrolase [Paludibacteraceae bacterium]